MSMDKKHWIDEVMERDPFNKERPLPELLRNRLLEIPMRVENTTMAVPKFQVWAFAAGLALLIAMNAFALQKTRENETATLEATPYTEYFSHYNSI